MNSHKSSNKSLPHIDEIYDQINKPADSHIKGDKPHNDINLLDDDVYSMLNKSKVSEVSDKSNKVEGNIHSSIFNFPLEPTVKKTDGDDISKKSHSQIFAGDLPFKAVAHPSKSNIYSSKISSTSSV